MIWSPLHLHSRICYCVWPEIFAESVRIHRRVTGEGEGVMVSDGISVNINEILKYRWQKLWKWWKARTQHETKWRPGEQRHAPILLSAGRHLQNNDKHTHAHTHVCMYVLVCGVCVKHSVLCSFMLKNSDPLSTVGPVCPSYSTSAREDLHRFRKKTLESYLQRRHSLGGTGVTGRKRVLNLIFER